MIKHKRPSDDDNPIERDPRAVRRFLATIRALLADVSDLPDRAADFGDSVEEKALSIQEWVEEHSAYSARQEKAIDNMARGVARWLEQEN